MILHKRGHVFLVGFMGSGKSTVAAFLAARAGRNCIDIDAGIERRTGQTILQIFSASGESLFRQLETEALKALDAHEPAVVAVGGGAPEAFANRRRMRRTGLTVWLDVGFREARRRIGEGTGRPRGQGKDSLEFRAFFERRRALYALADGRVAVKDADPEQVAAIVFERLEGFFD